MNKLSAVHHDALKPYITYYPDVPGLFITMYVKYDPTSPRFESRSTFREFHKIDEAEEFLAMRLLEWASWPHD